MDTSGASVCVEGSQPCDWFAAPPQPPLRRCEYLSGIYKSVVVGEVHTADSSNNTLFRWWQSEPEHWCDSAASVDVEGAQPCLWRVTPTQPALGWWDDLSGGKESGGGGGTEDNVWRLPACHLG